MSYPSSAHEHEYEMYLQDTSQDDYSEISQDDSFKKSKKRGNDFSSKQTMKREHKRRKDEILDRRWN